MPGSSRGAGCPHLEAADQAATPRAATCEACGSDFNLRACTTCGHVGCCESQQGHNTQHARAAGHPVIRSLPLGQGGFTWCYDCARYV